MGDFDITINDRGIRALKQAIDYTLDKWAGQEDIDQEALMELRPYFNRMLLEVAFSKDKDSW